MTMTRQQQERIESTAARVQELGTLIRALGRLQDEEQLEHYRAIAEASETPIYDERQLVLEAA